MVREFNYRGHDFNVVPIEGNAEEFIIIRDGRQTCRVKKEIAANAMQNVDKLFKD